MLSITTLNSLTTKVSRLFAGKDYFKQDLGHTFIRSSPVIPIHDHTVAFVNAGMNQFKGIFLDYHDPPITKAVNSQKCIRVTGKHNDLNVVGNDTYHHTFFEMLGNWSFGEYFKEEACRYAWDLLTKRYNIDKELLYVTYFDGDKQLELEADLECKDIWLNIGVAKDKIIPCGLQENFWEMGISGPCGPCTEIHIDYTKQILNQSMQINKHFSQLTELWNIVFIKYLRLTNGTIVPLPKYHIDTGMGLERLVAFLQGKRSNYDTDLFQPLFEAIQKYTKAPPYEDKFFSDINGINKAYRVLADHSRLITVALADGMIPEQSNKLRKIIRKAIDVGEKVFKKQGILPELSYAVAENLGDIYPELQNNLKVVQKIIRFEEDLYKKLQSTSGKEWKTVITVYPQLASITDWTAPGLVNGYKYLQSTFNELKVTNVLTGNVAFKLYDTYGLNIETITELAEAESLYFDSVGFQNELEKLRNRSRIGLHKSSETAIRKCVEILKKNGIPKTDDSFKYKYVFDGNNCQFPSIDGKIMALFLNDNILLSQENESISKDIHVIISKNTTDYNIKSNENEIGIILDKTVCYSSEGGQVSDKGSISIKDLNFRINHVRKIDGYIIHFGKFNQNNLKNWSEKLKIGDSCIVSIEPQYRIGAMQHHTGAHLLNACMKQVIQAVYPRNSLVLPHSLDFQFNSFGEKPSCEQLKKIEEIINTVIEADVPITTKVLNSLELLMEDSVTLIPGEIYPYKDIRIVEIDFPNLKSKEACCGTHVFKTGMLKHFCFINYFSKGASNFNVKAVVGSPAISAKSIAENIQSRILDLEDKLKSKEVTYELFRSISREIENEIRNNCKEILIPYLTKKDCLMKLKHLNDLAWVQAKEIEKSSIMMDIKRETNSCYFIVHCLHKNFMYLSLQEVISLYPNIPIFIIVYNNETVKARCSVPQKIASDVFNAQIWMNVILEIFDAKQNPVRSFNPSLVANMKAINISNSQKHLIHEAAENARIFAFKHIKSR